MIQQEEIFRVLLGEGCCIVQWYSEASTSALEGSPRARVIDQYLPHIKRGHAKKVRPAVEFGQPLTCHTQVRLVNESGGLQGVSGVLPPEVDVCQPVEFLIDQWGQYIQSGLITVTPSEEKLGQVPGCQLLFFHGP